jgi:hypothetical protein
MSIVLLRGATAMGADGDRHPLTLADLLRIGN